MTTLQIIAEINVHGKAVRTVHHVTDDNPTCEVRTYQNIDDPRDLGEVVGTYASAPDAFEAMLDCARQFLMDLLP